MGICRNEDRAKCAVPVRKRTQIQGCCLEKKASTPLYQRVLMVLIVLILVVGLISVVASLRSFEPGPSSGGRVWSEEHQHWHDAP